MSHHEQQSSTSDSSSKSDHGSSLVKEGLLEHHAETGDSSFDRDDRKVCGSVTQLVFQPNSELVAQVPACNEVLSQLASLFLSKRQGTTTAAPQLPLCEKPPILLVPAVSVLPHTEVAASSHLKVVGSDRLNACSTPFEAFTPVELICKIVSLALPLHRVTGVTGPAQQLQYLSGMPARSPPKDAGGILKLAVCYRGQREPIYSSVEKSKDACDEDARKGEVARAGQGQGEIGSSWLKGESTGGAGGDREGRKEDADDGKSPERLPPTSGGGGGKDDRRDEEESESESEAAERDYRKREKANMKPKEPVEGALNDLTCIFPSEGGGESGATVRLLLKSSLARDAGSLRLNTDMQISLTPTLNHIITQARVDSTPTGKDFDRLSSASSTGVTRESVTVVVGTHTANAFRTRFDTSAFIPPNDQYYTSSLLLSSNAAAFNAPSFLRSGQGATVKVDFAYYMSLNPNAEFILAYHDPPQAGQRVVITLEEIGKKNETVTITTRRVMVD